MIKKEVLVRVTVDLNRPETFPRGFINKDKLDATSEVEIKLQEQEDDDLAKLDALNKNAQHCQAFFISKRNFSF